MMVSSKIWMLSLISMVGHSGYSYAGNEGKGMMMNKPHIQEPINKAKEPVKKKLFNSKTCVLANGLRVVVVEDHLVPRISVGVLYNVGSADDPDNLVGISHMTEHMFFHGSKKYPHFDETISQLGGYTNACTSFDFTMYIEDCPSSALDLVLDMEADRMQNFYLENDKVFKQEQKAVFEERLRCIENQPLGLVNEYINRALSPQHPYGLEIIGMPHHIHAYTRDEVMNHYKRWYKPNNATLIIIGDVHYQDVFSKAEKTFGKIKKGKVPERVRVQNSIQEDLYQDITYYSDKVASNKVDLFYKAPGYHNGGLKKSLALRIGLDALIGGTVFQFARYFIDQKSLVSSLSSGFNYMSFDNIPLSISASLMPGVSIETFQKKFDDQIKKILQKGVYPRDFERAKYSAITALVYLATDGHRKIREDFIPLAQKVSLDDIEDYENIITSITLDDVNNVLKEVFSQKPIATVRFYPKKEENQKNKPENK